MSGNKILIDSNLIILASKKKIDLNAVLQKYEDCFISVITFIEVLGYGFENAEEKNFIKELCNEIGIIHTNSEIANYAISYREKKSIKIPDALILASARHSNAVLLTENMDDFAGIDKNVKIVSLKTLIK